MNTSLLGHGVLVAEFEAVDGLDGGVFSIDPMGVSW